jgi:thiol-disulfide isomerase/thioredoxin
LGAKNGRSFEAFRVDGEVVEIKVNQPLPASLFTMEMKDGVKVFDWRGRADSDIGAVLAYTYKKDRSKQQWQAILDAHQKDLDQARREKDERDWRIGQQAMDFAESPWFNTKPLKLVDLRDKVIVLDFWSVGCGPCRRDLPIMEAYHNGPAGSGIVFIGVHVRGNTEQDVAEFAKQHHLTYPIYLDAAPDSQNDGRGAMMAWYGIPCIPYAVVIDRDGKVAGHGELSEVIEKAQRLAAQKK